MLDLHAELLLKDVHAELSSVIEKWYVIGVQLGLNSFILDEIKQEYFKDDSRFKRMIMVWLKGNGKPVTWPTLIEALQAIDKNGIAEELRDKYKITGGIKIIIFWESYQIKSMF